MNRVVIIGAGAWGTALSLAALRANCQVTIWSLFPDEVEAINQHHENKSHLHATTDPDETSKADLVILVPPAQFMRSTCEIFRHKLLPHIPLIIASKGIENETSLLMSEVVHTYFPENPLLVLSGPSFAHEVANQLPTAVALAAKNLILSQQVADILNSPHFRLYPSDDIIGTQIGGACKNIIAIACGIVEGQKLGDNARTALVTYGLTEIARLGCAMGAKFETFLGLSGLGDITLTSLCSQSRNKSFGFALGQGTPLKELLATQKTLTEGVHTVSGTITLAKKHQVDMPITFAMNNLLQEKKTLKGFIEAIFSHHLNMEIK